VNCIGKRSFSIGIQDLDNTSCTNRIVYPCWYGVFVGLSRLGGKSMVQVWSRPLGEYHLAGGDYWDYFATRLVNKADIQPGNRILDVGCGTGASLFKATEKAKPTGYAVGVDICPG
jgi:SAM-dependent methyltransferase